MAILNSFVNDIFERIATEASSKRAFICYPSLLMSLRTRCLLEEVDYLFPRDPDSCASDPSW